MKKVTIAKYVVYTKNELTAKIDIDGKVDIYVDGLFSCIRRFRHEAKAFRFFEKQGWEFEGLIY